MRRTTQCALRTASLLLLSLVNGCAKQDVPATENGLPGPIERMLGPAPPIGPPKPAESMLTIEETVAAVYALKAAGVAPRRFHRSANPNAKPHLYKILADKHQQLFHSEVWYILAYIGDENDLTRLVDSIEKDFRGQLSSYEQATLTAMFECLGVMLSRGVAGAEKAFDTFLEPEYWKEAPFKWRERPSPNWPVEFDPLIHVTFGYALSGRDDVADHNKRLLNSIHDPAAREYFAVYFNDERTLVARRARATENGPIQEDERQRLLDAFNGDLDNPGPRDPATLD